MIINEQNRGLLGLAFQFYGRALSFPYDELTHELQHLFRDMEKDVDDDAGNTIAARVLEAINHYQGEDIQTLQAEYARLFSAGDLDAPVSLQLIDYLPEKAISRLQDMVWDEDSLIIPDEFQESVLFLLDFFASLLQNEEYGRIEEFFEHYIRTAVPALSERIYQSATLGFYREAARGLSELIFLCTE